MVTGTCTRSQISIKAFSWMSRLTVPSKPHFLPVNTSNFRVLRACSWFTVLTRVRNCLKAASDGQLLAFPLKILKSIKKKRINYLIIDLSKSKKFKKDKKTYLVALIVTDNEENRSEINLFIENLNKNLQTIEKVKKIKLIKEEFTIENGMLTPTLKLKRKKILEKYKEDLEKLY